MNLTVETTPIRELLIRRHWVFSDARGFFMEVFCKDSFEASGVPIQFVQLNQSR